MMVIRPVVAEDLAGLMTLAGETGGGLTSLPADEKTLAARIERSQKTWRGELPKSEQGYVFVLEETSSGAVVGICAIEVAVGLNDPWYNYRVGHPRRSGTYATLPEYRRDDRLRNPRRYRLVLHVG